MLIWIPVEEENGKLSKVATLINSKKWALVDFDKGEVQSIRFFDSREDFTQWVDFVILENKFESYIDFMNDGLMVLCVREEESIEDIMEAFRFKELDEVGL
jgi:predicted Fe-Mo cluster-binding NifX family protein